MPSSNASSTLPPKRNAPASSMWTNPCVNATTIRAALSTNRLFLQRVGGGYRFMHDLLRQHFANSYAQIQKRS